MGVTTRQKVGVHLIDLFVQQIKKTDHQAGDCADKDDPEQSVHQSSLLPLRISAHAPITHRAARKINSAFTKSLLHA